MKFEYPEEYPKYLVPKPNSNFPFIPESPHLLCRWGDSGIKGEIPDCCFLKEQLFDYSTNLIPLSKERDIKIKI